MSDVPAALETMLAAWNETEPGARRQLLEQALTENVRFVDPSIDLTGIDAFEANVIEVQGNILGAIYSRVSKVDGQHDFYRYPWAIHQHGKLLLQGFDTSGLNDEGKVQLVIGFFGQFSID